jgi:hypothetical protein
VQNNQSDIFKSSATKFEAAISVLMSCFDDFQLKGRLSGIGIF